MAKAILPCCGYGTRLHMPPDQSKELLIGHDGVPLIQYHLDLCKKYDITPLVITRIEKQDLIEYCNYSNVETMIIEPKGEWPETVMASFSKWDEHNILLLPDTRFSPDSVIGDMKKALELGNKAVIALHEVSDISKWGSVRDYKVTEKSVETIPGQAWGVIGFNKYYGFSLFNGMTKRNDPYTLYDTGFLHLDRFEDVTRNGTVVGNKLIV